MPLPLELTFACFHALDPSVFHISVTFTSTMREPSTAWSATTDSAGFLERTTPWARHRMTDRGGGD